MSAPAPRNLEISQTLINLRDSLRTPESMGRTLIEHVLTVAPTESKRRGDTMVLPAEITVTPLVRSGINNCFHLGISIGGHEVVGGDLCYSIHEI